MRRIAAELRISRYLVRRIIMDHQQHRAEGMMHLDLPTPPKSRGSILDVHIPFIQELLVLLAGDYDIADSRRVVWTGLCGEVYDRERPGASASFEAVSPAGAAI